MGKGGGTPGRVARIAGQLLRVFRHPSERELRHALDQSIGVIRFQVYDESVIEMISQHSDRLAFDRSVDNELARNPMAGATISNTNGWRKLRVGLPSRNKGTRGGARVIYYYAPEIRYAFLALAYPKNEADDISEDGKRWLRKLAADCEAYRPTGG